MPKLVIDELDVKLSRRDVIKLCEKNNISWLEYTNVTGGKYIDCIVRYNYDLNQSEHIDIYYNCIPNRKLYGLTFTQPKQFYVDLIMEYFKKDIKECSNCKKQHSIECPNSIECYATENKPYFERKDKSE